jgi:hypothetical protein
MNASEILTPTRAIAQKNLFAFELTGLIDLGPARGGYRLARHIGLTNYLLIDPADRLIFTDDQGRCFADLAHALRYARAHRNQLATCPLSPLPLGIAPTSARRRRAFDRAFHVTGGAK